jgi:hypothetical protein
MGLAPVSSSARLLKAGVRGDGALFAQMMRTSLDQEFATAGMPDGLL